MLVRAVKSDFELIHGLIGKCKKHKKGQDESELTQLESACEAKDISKINDLLSTLQNNPALSTFAPFQAMQRLAGALTKNESSTFTLEL